MSKLVAVFRDLVFLIIGVNIPFPNFKCNHGFKIFLNIFTGQGGSIIYGKEKAFVHCATDHGSGYWWGCRHTNGYVYAPTLEANLINFGKLDCPRIYISIFAKNAL